MKRTHFHNSHGFTILMGLVVLGAIAVAVTLSITLGGVLSTQSALDHQKMQQARSLSQACLEEALQVIRDDSSFTGSNILNLSTGDCEYTVLDEGGGAKKVESLGVVDTTVRKMEADVDSAGESGITLSVVEEVVEFEGEEGGVTPVCVNPGTESEETKIIPVSVLNIYLDAGAEQGACGSGGGDPVTVCYDHSDLTFYTSLKPSSSGTYPSEGTSSDTATLTNSYPTSTGYLYVHLNFSNLASDLSNISLDLDFIDLDLHGDNIGSWYTSGTLTESFQLYDDNDNLLISLNGTHPNDDDFSWSTSLSSSLIEDDSITLKMRFQTDLALTYGNYLQIANGSEGVENIDLCGETTQGGGDSGGEGGGDVTICHKPGTAAEQTMTISPNALSGHLGHGDHIGVCDDDDDDDDDD